MMTAKDYKVVADAIALRYDVVHGYRLNNESLGPEPELGVYYLACEIMDAFELTYPRFDRERFEAACQMECSHVR